MIQTISKIRVTAELTCPMASGVVEGVNCSPGHHVHVGDPLLVMRNLDGQSIEDIASDVNGLILDVVKAGDGITPNTVLATVDVSPDARHREKMLPPRGDEVQWGNATIPPSG